MREELLRRIREIKEEINNFDYHTEDWIKEDAEEKLKRLETLFKDMDY